MAAPDLDTARLRACLGRMRNGDAGAADEMLRAAWDRLEHMARTMLRRFPDVRRWEQTGDVLQAALVRLMRALGEVSPDDTRAFFGLAAEQMRRELLDLARRHRGPHGLGANLASAAGAAPGESSAPDRDPVDSEARDDLERWQAFHEAVARLPAGEREVVDLTFYHGWTQARIAGLLGVDERTVRRRWRAACLQLHEALGGELPAG
jgi:RNA polymerase sigma-70 factor (ECF subfamily)